MCHPRGSLGAGVVKARPTPLEEEKQLVCYSGDHLVRRTRESALPGRICHLAEFKQSVAPPKSAGQVSPVLHTFPNDPGFPALGRASGNKFQNPPRYISGSRSFHVAEDPSNCPLIGTNYPRRASPLLSERHGKTGHGFSIAPKTRTPAPSRSPVCHPILLISSFQKQQAT